MGIKAKFTESDVHRFVIARVKNMEQAIINRLILVGEQFVKNARENGNYNDITGNLRSSISYIVLNNGKRVANNTALSKKGSDKASGVAAGQLLISEIAAKFPTGYVLIVVAGMNYAAAVESKGKDVLSGSSIIAKNDLKQAIKDLKAKFKKK